MSLIFRFIFHDYHAIRLPFFDAGADYRAFRCIIADAAAADATAAATFAAGMAVLMLMPLISCLLLTIRYRHYRYMMLLPLRRLFISCCRLFSPLFHAIFR